MVNFFLRYAVKVTEPSDVALQALFVLNTNIHELSMNLFTNYINAKYYYLRLKDNLL